MKNIGENIISWQMIGLTIGGIAWGILGDKKGRKSVLFGSILLYSLATIANGFITNVDQYAWIRFIAGLGLAGELGASITAAWVTGIIIMTIGFISALFTRESFGKDLNFVGR